MTRAGAITERLYYHDSFLREFDAQVLHCERDGDRWRVELDRTAFYPTSGGQPHDLGKLGDVPVIEVTDAEEKVVHYTSAAVPAGPVRGEIDWARRIDHMQQHTGQHLLSAAFIELFQFHTVSFHLGREVSTIDLAAPSVVPRHLEQAERRTNEIIFEDRTVVVRFGTAEELAEAGIRKKVEREGVLRAVEIEGFDRQPCGGTHLARTGQAGLLLLRKLERRRDAWRLEFVCGYRALATARADYSKLGQAAELLSCGLPDVPAVLAKTLDDKRAQHGSSKRLEARLAEYEGNALLAGAETTAQADRLIALALDDASQDYLRVVAAKLVAAPGVLVLLASRTTGHAVFAQSKGGPRDMGGLLRDALKQFGGKGGGPKDFAQGSLPEPARADAFVAAAKASLKP
jgi:alanyl-tRNA synthetase